MENIFKKFGRILLREKISKVQNRLKFAGIKKDAESFTAIFFLIGVVISLLSILIAYIWLGTIWYGLIAFVIVSIVYFFLVTGIVGLLSDQRAKFAEKILPDALLLMSSNMRSGVSPDAALVSSAKSEFGFIANNIKIAGHKIATGIPIEKAFLTISEGIDSHILDQTIKLIIEGITSGAELASILEDTARDIKDNEIIRKEIRSMIFLYATFIFLAVAIISPILYSVSIELSTILSKLSETLSSGFLVEGATSTIPISPTSVSTRFLEIFAYTNILITSVFGSLMIALINRGNERYGLRYMPFVVGLAIILFNVGRIIMQSFFGGIRIL